MKTIRDMVFLCTDYLQKKGIEGSRREAEDLLSDTLGLTRVELYMQHDRPVIDSELAVCRERLVRRGKGEPLAYIHGEVEFLGCRIKVNRNVLIPRQETAQLVDRIIKQLQTTPSGVLWDICCGSGCIGIALKQRLPEWRVILSDISSEALAVARDNAQCNNVDVEFRQGDLLEPFRGEKANVIVSNPPYGSQADYFDLPMEVRDHEPQLALIGGPTGCEFYERLARELPAYLHPQSKVWFEIDDGQGKALMGLFSGDPWNNGEVQIDWTGRERFFSLITS